VTFDLWETLIIDQAERDEVRRTLRCKGLRKGLGRLGIDIPLEKLQRAYDDSALQLEASWRRNQHVPTMDQIRLILQLTGLNHEFPDDPETLRILEAGYVDPLLEVPPQLNGEAIDTLKGMQERVARIGLISNTGRSPGTALRRLMGKLGILEFFDSIVFSDEALCRKPDKRIFHRAAKELGTDAAHIIHIGDDPEADVWGAKQAGMLAILYEYPVPEGFKRRPSSLFAISRASRRIPDSEIRPDKRLRSLREALDFVDSLPR